MEILTFEDLQRQIQDLYHQGEYARAGDLAAQYMAQFPEQAPILYYWRSAMAARLGQTPQAVDLLRQVLEAGFWFGEPLLRRSPSYQSLQGAPEFEKLVTLNQRLHEADPTLAYPLLTLRSEGRCQAGGEPCPLLVALHDRAAAAQGSVDFWRGAASTGWLVAVPQSTQAMWKGAYNWDDREAAAQQVQKHLKALEGKYAVDPRQAVLAGHGQGGDTAIWLALTDAIRVQGFIAINPSGLLLDEPDSWPELIRESRNAELRAYFILGAEDETISHESLEALAEALEREGISSEIEEVSHAGHDFFPGFEDALQRALDFVT
ncbi:MAG TPA: dienelactone hydrolase family protein [Anaerolineales bacterium]